MSTVSYLPANPALSTYFTVFHFAGGIGNLLLLIVVALNRDISRPLTWYGFCFSWVPYSAAYLLLILTGHQDEPQPGLGVCLTQATLVYAGTTLTGAAMFSFVLHLWFNLRAMISDSVQKESMFRTITLFLLPYVAAFAVLLVALSNGASHLDAVHRNVTRLYCIVDTGLPEQVVSIVFIVVMAVIVFFEVCIAIVLYRHWVRFWGLKSRSTHAFVAIMIRVAVFTVFCVMSVIVCLVVLALPSSPIPSMFLALLPVVSFLLLGTQVDIIRTCLFWRTFSDAESVFVAPKDLENGDL